MYPICGARHLDVRRASHYATCPSRAELDPIVKTVEVPCSRQLAFTAFVQNMGNWWPLSRFSVSALGGGNAMGLRVEGHLGGRVTEVGFGGEEYAWGSFTAYEPHARVSLDFHIGEKSHSHSHLEVRFESLEPGRTRVELTQGNFEAFGKSAAILRGGYATGWNVIFERAFRAHCEALASGR